VQRLALLSVDHFRKPENRLYANGTLNGTTWEARHEIGYVKYLLRMPFVLFAVWLGGGLWWVAKRLSVRQAERLLWRFMYFVLP
jgi:hypothetical protein